MIAKTDAIFQGENLVQVILHGHLVVWEILYQEIIKAVRNPTYIDEGVNFARKIKLYRALCDATGQLRKSLYELNTLRNKISHNLINEEEAVTKHIDFPDVNANGVGKVQSAVLLMLHDLNGLEWLNSAAGVSQES